jgi:hypothetical protein
MSNAKNIWAVPGPRGNTGTAGAAGTTGGNAWTTTTAQFVQPAGSATVVVAVGDSSWAAVGQTVFVEGGGYYEVAAKPAATQLTLQNLNYAENFAPATVVALGKRVSPAGVAGSDGDSATAGADGDGAYLVWRSLNAPTNAFNLGTLTTGLLKITVSAGSAFPATASPGTDYTAGSAGLALLGLVPPGTNRLPYFVNGSTADYCTLTSFARGLLATDSAITASAALGLGDMSLQGSSAVDITGGTIDDIDLGGTATVSNRLVLSRSALTSLANGNNADVNLYSYTTYEVTTGPTAAFAICGIVAGVDGEIKIIRNKTAYDMTIAHESGVEATATRRIVTNTAADVTTTAGGCVTLQYSTNTNRWEMIASLL